MKKNYFKNLFLSQKFLQNIPHLPDPEDIPGGPGTGGSTPPPTYIPGLVGYSVNRYTTNVAVTEEMKVIDFINEVLFPASRMFMSQGANGKLRIHNKKPTSWGLVTEELSVAETALDVDDVRAWIADSANLLLIDPYTVNSEIKAIDEVEYSTAQNGVSLTASGNISIAGFSGAGGTTPATATATIDDKNTGVASNLTLDGVAFAFTASSSDTESGIAAFLAVAINAHPKTARRFIASASGDVLTIKGKFGVITLTTPLSQAHAAPVANPTTSPVGTATASGTLAAGEYKFAYSFVNHRGQTLLSPVGSVTISANEKITMSPVTPPAGYTVNWYIQPAAGSERLRLHSNNDGSGFVINELPLLTASLPPDFNRTGAEVMRVMASFSDRSSARSKRSNSNVLRATYEWLLGNRNKSVNRVDLKYRDARQDYRLIDLRISDNENIAKIKKTANREFNGQAIDNTFQALRIGLSLLAEYQSADFFYKWSSTREALLLEEGDVVAITDNSSGVVNLPVMIEELAFDPKDASIPRVNFTGRKYSSTLYDDSISDRTIPVIIEG